MKSDRIGQFIDNLLKKLQSIDFLLNYSKTEKLEAEYFIEQALLQYAKEYYLEKSKGLVEALKLGANNIRRSLLSESNFVGDDEHEFLGQAEQALADHEKLMEEK